MGKKEEGRNKKVESNKHLNKSDETARMKRQKKDLSKESKKINKNGFKKTRELSF